MHYDYFTQSQILHEVEKQKFSLKHWQLFELLLCDWPEMIFALFNF